MTYGSNRAGILFSFKDGQTRPAVISNVQRISNNGNAVALKKVFDLILKDVFSASNGARPNYPKSVLLFVTKDTDLNGFKEYAQKMKENNMNLVVVAIGGNVDLTVIEKHITKEKVIVIDVLIKPTTTVITKTVKKIVPGMLCVPFFV